MVELVSGNHFDLWKPAASTAAPNRNVCAHITLLRPGWGELHMCVPLMALPGSFPEMSQKMSGLEQCLSPVPPGGLKIRNQSDSNTAARAEGGSCEELPPKLSSERAPTSRTCCPKR